MLFAVIEQNMPKRPAKDLRIIGGIVVTGREMVQKEVGGTEIDGQS